MRRTALVLAALMLVLTVGIAAGCGGEEEATPTPDTITGTLTDRHHRDGNDRDDRDRHRYRRRRPRPRIPSRLLPATRLRARKSSSASAPVVSAIRSRTPARNGSIGPNLDDAAPSLELALDRITNGQGAMPSFSDQLTEQQIADVAAYVSGA